MRIAIANISRRRLGGAEEYLSRIIPELVARGHSVAFLYETDHGGHLPLLSLPQQVETWPDGGLHDAPLLARLRGWNPDVVYCNGLATPSLEAALSRVAPSIYSAHGYWGTCVSGTKSFALPSARPCDRRFGVGCLLNYYPRRCGGLNPITMLKNYAAQSRRLESLKHYGAIVVHSEYMKQEYFNHGFVAHLVRLPVPEGVPFQPSASARVGPWRLLFMGRMTKPKGVDLLIHAVELAQSKLRKPLHVTLAGDGPARHAAELEARRIEAVLPGTRFHFVGWVDEMGRENLLSEHDLLVVPSTWPEPFGMVGLEAASRGIPAVGFAVGGIPEWLHTGVNGITASADPPTADGLASAIAKLLGSDDLFHAASISARAEYEQLAGADVVGQLLKVFAGVLASSGCVVPVIS